MKEKLELLIQMEQIEREQYMNSHGTQLLDEMTMYIGYPEDELRDKLNYRLFIELLSANMLTKEQMTDLVIKLSGKDFLFHSIGEREGDNVFIRSFSALWLTGLLHVDSQIHFLTLEEAANILRETTPYLSRENDVRGFLGEKGWALAIVNGAELTNAIVSHPAFELHFSAKILEGIKESFWKGSVYIHDEEENLCKIIERLISKNIPEEILIEWVEQIFDKLQYYLLSHGYTPQYFAARTNTLHFMKQFYFLLKFTRQMPELMGIVSIFIGKWAKQ